MPSCASLRMPGTTPTVVTRNMSTGEILEQVRIAARMMSRGEVAGGPGRLTHGDALLRQFADARHHAYRGHGDVARGDAEPFRRHGADLAHGAHDGAVIAHRLISEVTRQVADDGQTVKTLWSLFDGSKIESVLMRYPNRTTLCISSQVGGKIGELRGLGVEMTVVMVGELLDAELRQAHPLRRLDAPLARSSNRSASPHA